MKKHSLSHKKRVNALFIERSTPFARDVIRLAAGLQDPVLDITHVLSVDEGIRRLETEQFDLILVGFPCKASTESISRLITLIADAPVLGFDRKENDDIPGNPLENRVQTSIPKSKVDSFTLGLCIPHVIERHELRNSIGKYVKKLLACEDRYRNIITKNADAILVVDTRGFILYANEAASVLLGRPLEALIGAEFGVPVIDRDSAEIQIVLPDNAETKKIVAMRVGKSEWESQEVSLVSLRDITDRKAMETELSKTQEKARSADEAKNSFLANISHEIRTPMNGILGMTELLLSTNLTKKQKEYLEMVRLSASSLLEIFNDIIDYSNIEAGRLQLAHISFNLHALLRSSISIFATLARKKGIATEYIISPDVPVYVTGDPGRLRQVIVNLIGNAIKFTDTGSVRLTAAVSPVANRGQDAAPVKIVFSVEDTGIGISKDNAKIIFDSFTQADGSFTRKFHGTGLGLSICKYLVEMMSGTITVDSEVGQGSTFSFSVMLKPAQRVTMEMAGMPQNEDLPSLPPLNILLAEDNKVNQIFASELLTSKGHSVLAVPNGADAIKALEEHTIDLVLMDVQMPEMDGLEATRRIRGSTSKNFDPKIPIIAMTAHALKGDRETFLSVGMNEYMSKPISWEKLHKTMFMVLASPSKSVQDDSRRESTSASISTQAEPETEDAIPLKEDDVVVDMDGLVQKARGNMEFLKKMFNAFVLDQPDKFQEMQEAFLDGDMKRVSFLAHALKGAAATMGAPRLRDAAYWLELSAKSQKHEESAENLNHIEQRLEKVIEVMKSHLD
ncbi:response regulator [Desulfovibrio inopinatus]|uniref:response regulator n=1 Tax=Desulfovibrio inopinatus TaxID=102109 RepID=UPI00040E6077|nr:response regulator [Desulfovibrio inopinatus]